jgi:hypothetical protein
VLPLFSATSCEVTGTTAMRPSGEIAGSANRFNPHIASAVNGSCACDAELAHKTHNANSAVLNFDIDARVINEPREVVFVHQCGALRTTLRKLRSASISCEGRVRKIRVTFNQVRSSPAYVSSATLCECGTSYRGL